MPSKFPLVFRAGSGPAPWQYLSSIAHEFTHELDVLIVDLSGSACTEKTDLPSSGPESTPFFCRGAGIATTSSFSHGLNVSFSYFYSVSADL
jgi:hypothetical protein